MWPGNDFKKQTLWFAFSAWLDTLTPGLASSLGSPQEEGAERDTVAVALSSLPPAILHAGSKREEPFVWGCLGLTVSPQSACAPGMQADTDRPSCPLRQS